MAITLASYVVFMINQLPCGDHLSKTQGLSTYTGLLQYCIYVIMNLFVHNINIRINKLILICCKFLVF